MRYFALVLALVGAATALRAQDAIPDLKAPGRAKARSSSSAATPIIPARTRPVRRDDPAGGRAGRAAGLGPVVIGQCRYKRALRLGDVIGQQVDHRLRYRRFLPHHPSRSRSDGKVLHPHPRQPERLDRGGVLPDGAGKEVAAQQAALNCRKPLSPALAGHPQHAAAIHVRAGSFTSGRRGRDTGAMSAMRPIASQ